MTDEVDEPLEVQFGGYCRASQKGRWEKARKIAKRSLSDWMRIVLDEAADRAIAEAEAKKKGK